MAPTAQFWSFSQTSLLSILFLSLFIVETTAYQGSVCCREAARIPETRLLYNHSLPWLICSLNQTDQYPDGTTFASVNVTMGWCRQNCPGIQTSRLSEWLQPVTTWIAPYIGLLLLCPIGGEDEDEDEKKKKKKKERWFRKRHTGGAGFLGWKKLVDHFFGIPNDLYELYQWFLTSAKLNFIEYSSILGDPASALAGTFFEITSDLKMIKRHHATVNSKEKPDTPSRIKQMIILIGDTDYKLSREGGFTDLTLEEEVQSNIVKHGNAEFDKAVSILVEARLDFFNAVFLPVILMLAVVASVFYDAYTKLGDNDTAHGLAFGVWFSWLLVLAVAGNCFAGSFNTGLTHTTFTQFLNLSHRRVPLRERYINSKLWESGMSARKLEDASDYPTNPTWIKMLGGQLFAWMLIAITSASAAAISYTTPTVGLGCRSFIFLLYSLLALATAILRVGCNRAEQHPAKSMSTAFKYSYWILVAANTLLMVIGTTLHFAGVYRNCRCNLLFAPDSHLVEVNSNTALAVNNASHIWLPVGYVAFGVIWIICAIVIAMRAYITTHIELWGKIEHVSHSPHLSPGVERESILPKLKLARFEVSIEVGENGKHVVAALLGDAIQFEGQGIWSFRSCKNSRHFSIHFQNSFIGKRAVWAHYLTGD
jgi:hypothetical protein